MKIKTAIATLALLLIVSCGKEKTETIKIDGKYLIELPADLTKTTGLNDIASLQYQNAEKDLYVVIFDEGKHELHRALKESGLNVLYPNDLSGYMKLAIGNYTADLDTFPPVNDVKIGGLNAKTMAFEGRVQKLSKVYYKMAFIEGKNRYYQIMTWTRADRKEEHEATMQKIIDSFKETGK
ncbi:hypothetical protein AAEO56_18220 [Flavobacterium sp. DGU11]|uniref:Lipoprotein n=1 Tax=Flavobacterium arundinis TaxID=3139143 RepID=A0ABU9I1B0_9FLAO